MCATVLVPGWSYVFHESIAWWGVQKTASSDLLGVALLDTSLLVRLFIALREVSLISKKIAKL